MTPVRVQLINDNILDILLLNVARSDITLFSFCRYLMFANPASLNQKKLFGFKTEHCFALKNILRQRVLAPRPWAPQGRVNGGKQGREEEGNARGE